MLQEPVEENKLDYSLFMVTNNLIDLYNEAAMDVSIKLLLNYLYLTLSSVLYKT